jgi:CRP/FNR family transcriptional regulator
MGLQRDTVIGLLQSLDWCSSLSREEVEHLAEGAVTVQLRPDEVIFEEGETGDRCYVIHSGGVKVVRRFSDGRRMTLAHLGPGAVFGELALFEGERRSATIQTTEDTIVVGLGAGVFMELMEGNSKAALGMALSLADRLRSANERLSEYALATTSGRVAATLLAQVEARQTQGAGAQDVDIVGTATDLARLTGADRDSATRVLHWLENEGVLTLKRGKILVHDPGALARYIG